MFLFTPKVLTAVCSLEFYNSLRQQKSRSIKMFNSFHERIKKKKIVKNFCGAMMVIDAEEEFLFSTSFDLNGSFDLESNV